MGKSIRSAIVTTRFAEEEVCAARRSADLAGVTVSSYIRSAVIVAVRRDQSRAQRRARREQERVRVAEFRSQLLQTGVPRLTKEVAR